MRAIVVDLVNSSLDDVGSVDLVFDVIGGAIQNRSAGLSPGRGALATVAGPPEVRPTDALATDFVVVSDRAQPGEVVRRVRRWAAADRHRHSIAAPVCLLASSGWTSTPISAPQIDLITINEGTVP